MLIQELQRRLGISQETIDDSKNLAQKKIFTKFSDMAPPVEDANLMSDLLVLPTASGGFKYLLVIVDISGNGHFDIEPLKNKTPEAVLRAMRRIFARPYLNQPKMSMTTDQGSEFKGIFHRFLVDEGIYHKRALVGRKTQMAVVESLNRILGRVIMGYLNEMEKQRGRTYKNWIPIIPTLREELNLLRAKQLPDYTIPTINLTPKLNKFNVGDRVKVYLDRPTDHLGRVNKGAFREGDKRWSNPTTIKKYYFFRGRFHIVI